MTCLLDDDVLSVLVDPYPGHSDHGMAAVEAWLDQLFDDNGAPIEPNNKALAAGVMPQLQQQQQQHHHHLLQLQLLQQQHQNQQPAHVGVSEQLQQHQDVRNPQDMHRKRRCSFSDILDTVPVDMYGMSGMMGLGQHGGMGMGLGLGQQGGQFQAHGQIEQAGIRRSTRRTSTFSATGGMQMEQYAYEPVDIGGLYPGQQNLLDIHRFFLPQQGAPLMAAGHDATLQSPHFASAGPPPGIGGRRNSIQLLEALSTSRRGSIDWQNPGMAAELANVNGAANQWTLPSQLQDASNGAQLNGAQLNGAQLNGAQLNGVQMPMHPQLGGLAGGLAPGLTGGLAGQPGGQQGLQQGGQQVREQFKQSVIEVASFLHQVRTESERVNEASAKIRKPEPIPQSSSLMARRTGSGSVYPVASPFEENSNVGICMLFPPLDETQVFTIDLEQFFTRCPITECVTSVRWAENVRGEPRKKTPTKKDDGRTTMRFNHCCFVSITLPSGFQHISVKVFKTGRLQTAGCLNGQMSLEACKVVGQCLQKIVDDGKTETVIRGNGPPELLYQLAFDAPYNVRLEKQSIMGVFDLGFKEKGFTVDMEELRMLLSHPDNSDRISRVHLPKSDKDCKVNRFQGLGVYVNKEWLKHGVNHVYCNIFPTGKCTVTAANSLPQAGEVAEVISKLIIDLFVQCRKRGVNTAPSKRARKR